MAEPIYKTDVTEIGPEVAEFLEAGLLILFQAGAPPELAEIAVLHEPILGPREAPPQPGDVLVIGSREFRITAIGSKAWKNVQDLGHAVFKFSGLDEAELPGEIHLQPEGADELGDLVQPGARVEIRTGA